MMALWLDVSVIFAFLGKCKLDCSILQNSRVTGWTRMSASSTAINCEKQTLNISELLPVIRVRIFDSGRVKQGRNKHGTNILFIGRPMAHGGARAGFALLPAETPPPPQRRRGGCWVSCGHLS